MPVYPRKVNSIAPADLNVVTLRTKNTVFPLGLETALLVKNVTLSTAAKMAWFVSTQAHRCSVLKTAPTPKPASWVVPAPVCIVRYPFVCAIRFAPKVGSAKPRFKDTGCAPRKNSRTKTVSVSTTKIAPNTLTAKSPSVYLEPFQLQNPPRSLWTKRPPKQPHRTPGQKVNLNLLPNQQQRPPARPNRQLSLKQLQMRAQQQTQRCRRPPNQDVAAHKPTTPPAQAFRSAPSFW